MDIETVREFCLSLPETTEDMAFGDDWLLIRVCDKIFACLALKGDRSLTVKCDPDYAADLRDHFSVIRPAWHWNKKYWNSLDLDRLGDNEIKSLITHSYCQVVKKIPKKTRLIHPLISSVEDSTRLI